MAAPVEKGLAPSQEPLKAATDDAAAAAEAEAERELIRAKAERRRLREERLANLRRAQAPTPGPNVDVPAGETASALRGTRANARELRRARARRLAARLGAFVLLPTVLAAVYYGSIASSQYESYTSFTIHSAEPRPAIGGGLDSLLGGGGGALGAARDVLAVRDYVLSRDMLSRLDKEHGFIAHYRQGSLDWWSRLAADASFEDAYPYYEEKVHADFDMTSGTVTLRVRAFSAEKANTFARAVLSYSEEMVNKLSERERRDRTQYAEGEVKKSEERLSKARKELLALQQKHADFNPQATATAAMSVRTQLEGELARARAELMQLKSYMNADAPQVQAAQQKVSSIAAQVAQESRRLVDPKNEGGISGSFGEFEAANVEKEFAQKAYESTLVQLEIARSDAGRQHRYLATIASPSTPDESTYPKRIRGVITVFVVSFLLMGIGTLMTAAVREHARL